MSSKKHPIFPEVSKGIKTVSGEQYFAKKIVSNISPYATYKKLLSSWDGSQKQLTKIEKLELSMSGTQVYIGLDAPISEIWKDLNDDHEIFWNASTNFSKSTEQFFSKKHFSGSLPGIGITLFSNTDASMSSKKGGGAIGLFIPDVLARWEGLSDEEYKKRKSDLETLLIKTAEKVLPHLSDHIAWIETGTPKTMALYTGNPQGALYGFAQTVSQGGFFKRFSMKSPLKNLLFASAWTFPGGGFEGTMRSGGEAAKYL